MSRETVRRLALLAIVGTLATAWTIALQSPALTPTATASPNPARSTTQQVAVHHIGICPFPRSLRPAFIAAARDASLPPALLYAVATVESNLHEDAQSAAGARGLLQ